MAVGVGRYAVGMYDVGRYDVGMYDVGRYDVGMYDVGRYDVGMYDVGMYDIVALMYIVSCHIEGEVRGCSFGGVSSDIKEGDVILGA